MKKICSKIVQNTMHYSVKQQVGLDDFLPYFLYVLILCCPKRLISNFKIMYC